MSANVIPRLRLREQKLPRPATLREIRLGWRYFFERFAAQRYNEKEIKGVEKGLVNAAREYEVLARVWQSNRHFERAAQYEERAACAWEKAAALETKKKGEYLRNARNGIERALSHYEEETRSTCASPEILDAMATCHSKLGNNTSTKDHRDHARRLRDTMGVNASWTNYVKAGEIRRAILEHLHEQEVENRVQRIIDLVGELASIAQSASKIVGSSDAEHAEWIRIFVIEWVNGTIVANQIFAGLTRLIKIHLDGLRAAT